FFGSDASVASHPFVASLSQLSRPESHWKPHVPFEHVDVEFPGAEQLTPHPPQLLVSVRYDTSHPFVASLSQSTKPEPHWMALHEPFAQVPDEFGPAVQTVPHPPQFLASLSLAVSHPLTFLSQSAKPSLHWIPQTPFVQLPFALVSPGHAVL